MSSFMHKMAAVLYVVIAIASFIGLSAASQQLQNDHMAALQNGTMTIEACRDAVCLLALF